MHLGITAAYVAAAGLPALAHGRPTSPGKNLIVATTWLTWYVGIVVLDSDYAFTVTNVLVHGIPYLAFVWVYGRARFRESAAAVARALHAARLAALPAPLLAVAFVRGVGLGPLRLARARRLLPGTGARPGAAALWPCSCPLLALPQATHYVLDAWVWRVRPENPELARYLGFS